MIVNTDISTDTHTDTQTRSIQYLAGPLPGGEVTTTLDPKDLKRITGVAGNEQEQIKWGFFFRKMFLGC